jgi:hypothetical protein
MFLIGTSAMLAQKTTVNGITLSYDQKTKLMTLTTPERYLKTSDSETTKRIIITNEETYYHMEASPYFMGYSFTYYRIPLECTKSASNDGSVFKNPESGVYTLTISDVSADKRISNKASGTITVR